MLSGLQEGRIVHYVYAAHDLDDAHQHLIGAHRAAIVVNSWPGLGRDDGYSNLIVFRDGPNDGLIAGDETPEPLYLAFSRVYSSGMEPCTWHWPERATT